MVGAPAIENSGQRFAFLDALRGGAALLVITAHSLEHSKFTELWNGLFSWISYGAFGVAGVAVFFFVSGYIIPISLEKRGDIKLFFISRALRIYPLYIFIYFLTILASGQINFLFSPDFLPNLTAHLLFVQEYVKQQNYVGGSWTLSLEAIWYIGFAFLFFTKLNRNNIFIIVSVTGVCLIAQALSLFVTPLPLGRLSMLVACVTGMFFYRYSAGQMDLRQFTFFVSTLLLTILANLTVRTFAESDNPSMLNDLIAWVIATTIFIFVFANRHSRFWNAAFLRWLGEVSYSLYLLHSVIIILLLRLTPLTGLWFILTVFITTIPLALLTFKYIETPPIKLGRSLANTRRQPQNQNI
ncbi:acyltransferase family protein [Asticcacaulis tiandongensis]|uniref:acyltransferase family protein n=1 Tax=Asticcacaulis tiandongensis TaxID=2565365 RepID=UPI001127F758|nr:acyltransferase [Asticcacaulis tiandongensis]